MANEVQADLFGGPIATSPAADNGSVAAAPKVPTSATPLELPSASPATPPTVPLRPIVPSRHGLSGFPRRPSPPAATPAPIVTAPQPSGGFAAMRRAAGSAPAGKTVAEPAVIPAPAVSASAPVATSVRSGFSGMRSAAGSAVRSSEQARTSSRPVRQDDPMAGRGEPPARDAGWLAILNWACRGAIDADRDDIDLALKVWSGWNPTTP